MAPFFLFVSGSWHTAEVWDSLRARLAKAGYESDALEQVSTQRVLPDMTEDVAAIRAATLKLVERGEDVIVVLHSYGGQPGSNAMKGLGKEERVKQGEKGGVIRLVYIMAYMLPEGKALVNPEDPPEAVSYWMQINPEQGTSTVSPENGKKIFYHDLPDAEATHWAAKLKPWSIGCAFSPSTYAAWRYIPSTYVLTHNDQTDLGKFSKGFVESAKSAVPTRLDTVEEIGHDAGHFPMLSQEDEMVAILERAVKTSS